MNSEGTTKKSVPCKRKPKLGLKYCYLHEEQGSSQEAQPEVEAQPAVEEEPEEESQAQAHSKPKSKSKSKPKPQKNRNLNLILIKHTHLHFVNVQRIMLGCKNLVKKPKMAFQLRN